MKPTPAIFLFVCSLGVVVGCIAGVDAPQKNPAIVGIGLGLAEEYLKEKAQKTPTAVPTAIKEETPVLVRTEIPDIATPPLIENTTRSERCTTVGQTPDGSFTYKGRLDGKGGTLWKASDSQPGKWAFGLRFPSPVLPSVKVCDGISCQELPYTGLANPDESGERRWFKGSLPKLKARREWVVYWETCSVRIPIKKRQRLD